MILMNHDHLWLTEAYKDKLEPYMEELTKNGAFIKVMKYMAEGLDRI